MCTGAALSQNNRMERSELQLIYYKLYLFKVQTFEGAYSSQKEDVEHLRCTLCSLFSLHPWLDHLSDLCLASRSQKKPFTRACYFPLQCWPKWPEKDSLLWHWCGSRWHFEDPDEFFSAVHGQPAGDRYSRQQGRGLCPIPHSYLLVAFWFLVLTKNILIPRTSLCQALSCLVVTGSKLPYMHLIVRWFCFCFQYFESISPLYAWLASGSWWFCYVMFHSVGVTERSHCAQFGQYLLVSLSLSFWSLKGRLYIIPTFMWLLSAWNETMFLKNWACT